MDNMVESLRKVTIKKRFNLAFLLCCLIPIFIVIVADSYFYTQQNRARSQAYNESLAYQSEVRITQFFDKIEEKMEYLSTNADIRTDLHLYYYDQEYKTDQVVKRIEDTLSSIVSTQEGISFAMVMGEGEIMFTYGNAMIDKTEVITSSETDPKWHNLSMAGNDSLYLIKKAKLRYDSAQYIYFVISINQEYLDKLCEQSRGSDLHQIYLIDSAGTAASNKEIKNDTLSGNTILTINIPIKDTSYTIVNEFHRNDNIGIISWYVWGIVLLCLIASYGIMNMAKKSLLQPLDTLLERIKHSWKKGEDGDIIILNQSVGIYEDSKNKDIKDEHALLDREFSKMLSRLQELIRDNYQIELKEIYLQEKIKELELNALQQQINPHFLYNTLENILWLAQLQGYEKICEMISALGAFFKTSISEKEVYVNIKTEIENAKSYVRLQQAMNEERFCTYWDVDERILTCKSIKLMLQPIIENAIVHGLEKVDHGGEIHIKGMLKKESILFEISDNGQGMEPEQNVQLSEYMNSEIDDVKKSIGMRNVNQRIKIYFGNQYGIHIKSELSKGTVVILEIPIKE